MYKNVWHDLRTKHKQSMGFYELGVGLNGSGHTDRSECDMIKNDPFNTICLTHITNKYSSYFTFTKYLLYPTYILNLKNKKIRGT